MLTRGTQRPTLASGLDLHDNALNLLRLILATLVIVSHSRPLGGYGDDDPYFGRIKLGTIAVAGFFAVSGYLVSRSRLRQRPSHFLIRRFARIYPGYWLSLLVTVFGLSALIGARRGGWSLGDAAQSFVSGLGLLGWPGTVGSTLHGMPVDSTLNGSLWTLPYEIFCYLALAAGLSLLFVRRRLRFWSLFGVLMLMVAGVLKGAQGGTSGLLLLVCFFSAGVALQAWQESIELSHRFAAVAAVVTAVSFLFTPTLLLAALPFAYLCLWFGAVCPPRLKKIGATNDVSYGVYLYGWPVQQTLTAYGVAGLGYVGYTAVALLAVGPLAWMSWLLVERPANHLAKTRTAARARRAAVATPVDGTPGGAPDVPRAEPELSPN
ncbi:acyltransferase family protein [Nocardioides pocheonensis]|uniref:Acyltransferase n=1 Tax=Nocardioides pocheonensis TaxID=661485 RepID=A0A3N0GQQ2_9ACTN|nr:acyltransferase [Nocardioides pocheonensis]RNM14767.1 acyltransferase [Nocardioides pocheonensis]